MCRLFTRQLFLEFHNPLSFLFFHSKNSGIMLAMQLTQIEDRLCKESIKMWKEFLKNNSWQHVIEDIEPKECGCGLVYELPNFLNRNNESFAIADMRNIPYSEPHYHSPQVTEIYFVLQGSGIVVVGNNETFFSVEDVIIIPPMTSHYVMPDKQCVLAVVNIPIFNVQDYHVLTETNHLVKFDKKQFERLTKHI